MSKAPAPLQVKNKDDWEDISCHIMSWLILQRSNVRVAFEAYGRDGQQQHEVDILTFDPRFSGILGQAKYKSPGHALELEDLLSTLRKTSTYANRIDEMVLLTNGLKNTRVDDFLVQSESRYTNKNNVTFGFSVMYWQDFRDYKFIPARDLIGFFPEIAEMTGHFTQDPYETAARAAQLLVPQYLSREDIEEVRSGPAARERPSDQLDNRIIELLQGLQKAEILAAERGFGADPDARRLLPMVRVGSRLFQALVEYRKSHLSLVPDSEIKAWSYYEAASRELVESYYQLVG